MSDLFNNTAKRTLGIGGHQSARMKNDEFKTITGWTGSSNEHTRDAAMVAWPYRSAA